MKSLQYLLAGAIFVGSMYFLFTYNDEAEECLKNAKSLIAELNAHTIPESEVEQYPSFPELLIHRYPKCEEHIDGGGSKEEKCERAKQNKWDIDEQQAKLGYDPREEIRLEKLEKQYLDSIYRNCHDQPEGYDGV